MPGEKALNLIVQIDKSLEKINEVLHRAQPPYPGKSRIIFIDEGGHDRMPSFTVLKTNRNKQRYVVKRWGTHSSLRFNPKNRPETDRIRPR
jgi:hypothetical protein